MSCIVNRSVIVCYNVTSEFSKSIVIYIIRNSKILKIYTIFITMAIKYAYYICLFQSNRLLINLLWF
jgi:hypothetical protein